MSDAWGEEVSDGTRNCVCRRKEKYTDRKIFVSLSQRQIMDKLLFAAVVADDEDDIEVRIRHCSGIISFWWNKKSLWQWFGVLPFYSTHIRGTSEHEYESTWEMKVTGKRAYYIFLSFLISCHGVRLPTLVFGLFIFAKHALCSYVFLSNAHSFNWIIQLSFAYVHASNVLQQFCFLYCCCCYFFVGSGGCVIVDHSPPWCHTDCYFSSFRTCLAVCSAANEILSVICRGINVPCVLCIDNS